MGLEAQTIAMTKQEIEEVLEERRVLITRAKQIITVAEVAGRELDSKEREEYDGAMLRIKQINMQFNTPQPLLTAGRGHMIGGELETAAVSPFLSRNQKVADLIVGKDEPRLDLGKYLRGIVTSSWTGSEAEHRAAQEGTGSLGGWLVPSGLSSIFLDVARSKSVATAAGMVTYIMTDAVEDIARQISDFTVSFVKEGSAIPPSDIAFDKITLRPVFAASLCKVSIALLSDSKNIESILTNALTKSMGQAIDAAALTGSGIDAPRGLTATPGVNLVAAGGALTSYAPFSLATQAIQVANGQPNACLLSPASAGELDRLVESTTGQPLRGPDSWTSLEKHVSSAIPDDLAMVGDFTQLLLAIGLGESGQRGGVRIEVSRESSFNTLEVELRCTARIDVACLRAPWFSIVQGIA
jgi:HK97 family phage major capsid protein